MGGAVGLMHEEMQRRSSSRASSPSREAQQRSWYSAAPNLAVYDDEIINVLLNVARRHIAPTFRIFADFAVTNDTRVELCLAMAALGGLYCGPQAPGSNKVAQMLYNDARRLLLEKYLLHAEGPFKQSLSIAKTFILLEVYGLCSGDKRGTTSTAFLTHRGQVADVAPQAARHPPPFKSP